MYTDLFQSVLHQLHESYEQHLSAIKLNQPTKRWLQPWTSDGQSVVDQATLHPETLQNCLQLIDNMPNIPNVTHGTFLSEYRAVYDSHQDTVFMPPKETFRSEGSYFKIYFHELAHSTGHRSRLAREDAFNNFIHSYNYGYEEIVAEMTAATLVQYCATPKASFFTPKLLNDWIGFTYAQFPQRPLTGRTPDPYTEETPFIQDIENSVKKAATFILGEDLTNVKG